MVFLRRCLLLACAFLLSGGSLSAAGGRENRDYAAAAAAFQDGMYGRAETAFAQFVEKYPKSERIGEAVLLQAQAELKLGKFADAIALLTDADNQAKAGKLADEYVYWTGEAQFQDAHYPEAAETWIGLAQRFPASKLRLKAVVAAASAFTEQAGWSQVVALLEATNGVFLRAAQLDPGGESVVQGKLLLSQAKFELNNDDGAAAILQPLLDLKSLKPELRRKCALLFYRVKIAAGQPEAALAVATNFLQIARRETNADWIAEGVALQAGALEKLGRVNEAIAAYRENLTNAPAEQQREAVLKIVSLAIGQNQFSVATNALANFLLQFSNSPAADIALLTLGELELKRYVAGTPDTNALAVVQVNFDQFIGAFTNSPLLGKAYLDRGWCNWLVQKIPESLADFAAAARLLPFSEELAVAKFKAGDALMMQGNYSAARTDYESVLDDFTNLPAVVSALGEQALYQCLRANLALNDAAGAHDTLIRILKNYPEGDLSDNAILLVAESVDDARRPVVARALLQQFEKQFPDSELLPQARLAVARTYEQEQNWPAAITNYENWLAYFPTNDLRSQADYSLAWADFQAGNETNAFLQFTNFIAQFPTNRLAPLAQWWVADHFYRAGDFENAERNYKPVFQNTNWQSSSLANQTNLYYPAQLMAGRAAVARLDYTGAIRDYFSKLEQDTNCPLDLRVQATFAHGDALMRSDSSDTNNPLANFGLATNEFFQVAQLYPTNNLGLLALFYIGECNVQLTNYDTATNAYAQVLNSPFAGLAARSQAQIALGVALEKKAALLSGAGQTALLNAALDNYLAVFWGENLRDGEQPDPFWLKKAGLQAAPLVGLLNDPDAERKFYGTLKKWLPQLADTIDKKIAALSAAPN